jgi:hypothetical protein
MKGLRTTTRRAPTERDAQAHPYPTRRCTVLNPSPCSRWRVWWAGFVIAVALALAAHPARGQERCPSVTISLDARSEPVATCPPSEDARRSLARLAATAAAEQVACAAGCRAETPTVAVPTSEAVRCRDADPTTRLLFDYRDTRWEAMTIAAAMTFPPSGIPPDLYIDSMIKFFVLDGLLR